MKFKLIIFALVATLLAEGRFLSPAFAQDQNPAPDSAQQAPSPSNPQPESPPKEQNSSSPETQTPTPPESKPSEPEAKPPENPPTPGAPRLARKKNKRVHKRAAAQQSGKVVVRNGGAKENSAQLSPGVSNEQAAHQRENTTQLLATTDANLKRVAGRELTPAQQSTVDQIHAYMRQSKTATDAGDLARAHTLAYKAHLLSDELARR